MQKHRWRSILILLIGIILVGLTLNALVLPQTRALQERLDIVYTTLPVPPQTVEVHTIISRSERCGTLSRTSFYQSALSWDTLYGTYITYISQPPWIPPKYNDVRWSLESVWQSAARSSDSYNTRLVVYQLLGTSSWYDEGLAQQALQKGQTLYSVRVFITDVDQYRENGCSSELNEPPSVWETIQYRISSCTRSWAMFISCLGLDLPRRQIQPPAPTAIP